MIEVAKLNRMLSLEVAASTWFHKLSEAEQNAYLKAHPGSKLRSQHKSTKYGNSSDVERLAKSADRMAEHHARMVNYHTHPSRESDPRHRSAAAAHDKAMNAFYDASEGLSSGDYRSGLGGIRRGLKHRRLAKSKSDALKQ